MPEAETRTVSTFLDRILHELRRALRGPIYRIYKGGLAALHEYALAQGWLTPSGQAAAFLRLTDLGLKVLAADQCRRGLPP